jgi:hypothetical protein
MSQGLSEERGTDAIMDKTITCAGCNKAFEVVGTGGAEEARRTVYCPTCGARNTILWPKDGSYQPKPGGKPL